MKFHPFSEPWPLIEGADFDELVADIRANGLREPIWLYQGQILDGRNRYRACQKANEKLQTREFRGSDAEALILVVSLNARRRHLTTQQRAFAAAAIADLAVGSNQHAKQGASRDAPSQEVKNNQPLGGFSEKKAAEVLDVSESSLQRAKKVKKKGSKALQKAAQAGQVPLQKAAAVVELPKSEQLAAAKSKPEKESADDDDDDGSAPDAGEEERLAAMEREYAASIEKVMKADDKLAAAHAEIKRQAAEIATLKLSRNGFQNRCAELTRRVKALTRENDRLKKKAA